MRRLTLNHRIEVSNNANTCVELMIVTRHELDQIKC